MPPPLIKRFEKQHWMRLQREKNRLKKIYTSLKEPIYNNNLYFSNIYVFAT